MSYFAIEDLKEDSIQRLCSASLHRSNNKEENNLSSNMGASCLPRFWKVLKKSIKGSFFLFVGGHNLGASSGRVGELIIAVYVFWE
jgi:hypothetical protein